MKHLFIHAILFLIIISACRKSTINNNSSNSNLFENMIGVIEYTNYEPLSNKPFNIHYYIPSTVNQTTAPILFIFPGTDRNADDYLETWITLADQKGVMVFAFEFSVDYYPMSTNYQTGFILDENGNLNNEDVWTFSVIEPVFDFIKTNLVNNTNSYNMFGHSAGGQFVHRFVQFKPNSRLNYAVSANAGWYTVPDTSVDFPYGLKNTGISNEDLQNSYLKNLEIHLGQNDNNPNDPALRKTPEANIQGLHRLSRGRYFVNQSDSISQSLNFPSSWVKKELENVGHEQQKMAVFAAQEMY